MTRKPPSIFDALQQPTRVQTQEDTKSQSRESVESQDTQDAGVQFSNSSENDLSTKVLEHKSNNAVSNNLKSAGRKVRDLEDRKKNSNPKSQKTTSAKKQYRENSAEIVRINHGFVMRVDYIREVKILAAEDDKNIYEILEEAVKDYLKKRGKL